MPDITDSSYQFPKDGGIDKIQIASEMKPRLCIPIHNTYDYLKYTTNTKRPMPVPQLWRGPCSISSIDLFLAVNGLVSPFDVEHVKIYQLPDTKMSCNGTFNKQSAVPINKVIATFDHMVKKIEPMSGRELAMKKQWVLS